MWCPGSGVVFDCVLIPDLSFFLTLQSKTEESKCYLNYFFQYCGILSFCNIHTLSNKAHENGRKKMPNYGP